MDSAINQGQAGDDLSALAWVHGELRRSLEAANRALRRYLKEAETASASEVDAVDPAVLRTARNQLHQGVGALELVGFPAVANVLRASEAAVQRMVSKPALVTPAAVDTVEKVSFALLDFLSRQLAGKPISPVALFPQYRAVQQLAGADRIHPADLWKIDWQWHELPPEPGATPRHADEEARGMMETLVLGLMRSSAGTGSTATLKALSDLCADLSAGARAFGGAPHLITFWQLAAAAFEAQAQGLLPGDNYTKRIASRLLAQVRPREGSPLEVSDRLAADLLFFCSHAKAPEPGLGRQAPRLAAVRKVWQLKSQPTADYETPRLGRFDPAVLVLARKRVAAAKDSWSAVAGGELHRLAGLPEQFSLVGESLQRLLPGGEGLAAALQAAVTRTVNSGLEPPAPLAMEVATGILYLDASLEDGEFDHPELAERVQRLSQRIDAVREGAEPQPLDVWMEELYRRVSDRQTMGSVVQELRASLSEVEKQIDQYFRDPSQRQLLIPVPAQLSSMRGVLSVLGLDQASAAALHMRDDVDALAQTEVDPQRAVQTGTFDRLADNLGALSFLIDMLSVQPALAKSLFRFDPATGALSAVMGQTERTSAFSAFDDTAPVTVREGPPPSVPLLDQLRELAVLAAKPGVSDLDIAQRLEPLSRQAFAADQPELARLLGSAQIALRDGADEATRAGVRADLAQAVASLAPPPAPAEPASAPVPAARPAPATGATGLEDDAEMRDIFIEEAQEVIADARAALERLADAPDNATDLTTVRRAFHTLKGSSRMVGLSEYGEGAWACEQLYNARLASAPRMDTPLRLLSGEALNYLAGWTDAIANGHSRGHNAADLARAADAMRLDGTRLPITMPAGAPTDIVLPAPAPAPVDAPEAVLDPHKIKLPVPGGETTEILPAGAPVAPDFDLDLAEPEDEDALPANGTIHVPEPLAARVPDLPAAADLDLAPPAPAPAPSFDLDLAELGDAQAVPLPDLPLDAPFDAALPGTVADEVQLEPLPQADAVEISLDDLDADFVPSALGTLTERTEVLEERPFQELAEPVADAAAEPLSIDLDFTPPAPPAVEVPAEVAAAVPAPEPGPEDDDEQVKVIGPLRIGIPLFNIYLNEADELSRRLVTELAEWAVEAERHPVPESSTALAHSLAGNSATVGFADLSALARALEHALMRSHSVGFGRAGEPALFTDAADEIRRLLHQFAAGFLREVEPELMERLAAHERLPMDVPPPPPAPGLADELGVTDHIDEELLPIFEEEAEELLPQLQARLRDWLDRPGDPDAPMACMRTLHTVKGGARLAGAMRLGEMAHRLESAIEELAARGDAGYDDIEPLMARADAMSTAFDGLRKRAPAPAPVVPPVLLPVATPAPTPAPAPVVAPLDLLTLEFPPEEEAEPALDEAANEPSAEPVPAVAEQPLVAEAPVAEPVAEPAAAIEAAAEPELEHADDASDTVSAPFEPELKPQPALVVPPPPPPAAPVKVDWQRFAGGADVPAAAASERAAATGGAVVRVRSGLLDRMVNQAGEVSITRARIDSDVKQLQGSLGDLTDSLERMRRQLRDIELQAETQIASRMEAAKAASQAFDPLEMDRFTRFQELTRFMAESVNDVATLQRGLQRTLQSAEDELAAQARLTRELQDDLLRTRMVEFESMADRLHRTARQAARETGKQVRLDIVGGAIEVDRGVLERMAGSFEHLLRNSVAHGIETPEQRAAAGKDASGVITVTVAQAGNEVAVEFADDGGGLDVERIRRRAVERGLLAADAAASEDELRQLVFRPGFSTAETVTELAGRGVGLDVVRAEVNAMGGRVETQSETGRGTRFKLLLPLTTAVTQVVMLRCGELTVAVPSTLIELVRRVPNPEVAAAYESSTLEFAGESVPFFWLSALLRAGGRGELGGRTQTIVIVRSASQRVAVHVDEVVGNQEVVVKNVGPQLARLPGLAGVTLLPSGAVALIYNPVALASLYGEEARAATRQALAAAAAPLQPMVRADEPARAALVMVVDDSLTVRRVTQRLLVREGYRVVTAKDGLEALEVLADERPVVLLSDIEMPRMDGFDLLRNVRADPRLAGLPVVMITSRTAQKHRDYAAELGADHYLGKPYAEEELLTLVARYAGADVVA
jgi:chemosensory pili system protein ChpA (sensor histidine kinase/response regulator)